MRGQQKQFTLRDTVSHACTCKARRGARQCLSTHLHRKSLMYAYLWMETVGARGGSSGTRNRLGFLSNGWVSPVFWLGLPPTPASPSPARLGAKLTVGIRNRPTACIFTCLGSGRGSVCMALQGYCGPRRGGGGAGRLTLGFPTRGRPLPPLLVAVRRTPNCPCPSRTRWRQRRCHRCQ
jgi:hypothetical protein